MPISGSPPTLGRWRLPANVRYAQSLPIFHGGLLLLFVIRKRSSDGGIQPFTLMLQRRMTLLRQRRDQVANQGSHPPHYLHAGRAAEAYLLKCEPQEILPGRIGDHQSQGAFLVSNSTNFEAPSAQAQEMILDLIKCLNRGGRIIDRWRQGFNRDVHQQTNCVFGVLLKGPVGTSLECPSPS